MINGKLIQNHLFWLLYLLILKMSKSTSSPVSYDFSANNSYYPSSA